MGLVGNAESQRCTAQNCTRTCLLTRAPDGSRACSRVRNAGLGNLTMKGKREGRRELEGVWHQGGTLILPKKEATGACSVARS